MPRFSSLGTRLLVAVLATAGVAFAVLAGLTLWRLDRGLERQASQLAQVSEEKLGQRLDGEARLARARIGMLFAEAGRSLENIAQRADIVKAVSSGNDVAISELLRRAAATADIDGIVVVDTKLRVFGADRGGVDLAATNKALGGHPIAKEMMPILADNDRRRPAVLRQTVKLSEDLAAAVGAKITAPLAVIIVEPIFDDFGEVFAALIAHRVLRGEESTLTEFSELEGAGLLVLAEDRRISAAGVKNPPFTVQEVPGSTLLRTNDRAYWSRCTELFEAWRICALAPVSELHALRDELVRIGEIEGRSLATWLFIFALVSLALFAGITLLAARRISRPLAQITEAVRAVARGDWKSDVSGLARKDEVGDIARAVVVLQRSLEERDRLRTDVAQAESVKKRREALEDAIRRFDRVMRSVLLSVSDCVETMDETAKELARMSAVAEGEAAEAAFVSENTVANVSTLRSATERLSASISETADQLRQTAEVLSASNTAARSASGKAEHFARIARDVDTVVHGVNELAVQINTVALNATIQASRAGNGSFDGVAADIRTMAERIGAANDDVATRVASFRSATDEAAGSVRSIAHKLDHVLQQTRTIALAVERQDAVTREIVNNMSAAANGTLNVSSSVERLKATIEEARSASMKVVTKATDMADEAHRLDSTVKSFLREVTA
jgi:methyl-accepting chemotaxis protein